jgi:hypothetical protein
MINIRYKEGLLGGLFETPSNYKIKMTFEDIIYASNLNEDSWLCDINRFITVSDKNLIVSPRRTGKSTFIALKMAEHVINESPEQLAIIAPTNGIINDIIHIYHKIMLSFGELPTKNIYTHVSPASLLRISVDRAYIDETSYMESTKLSHFDNILTLRDCKITYLSSTVPDILKSLPTLQKMQDYRMELDF